LKRSPPVSAVRITLPAWVNEVAEWDRSYDGDDARMSLAVQLARRNVAEGTGGPFGAAILESHSGKLVSVGVNMVVPAQNSVLHAEVVAIMMAQARLGNYTLGAPGLPAHELVTSCAPCAMCLGATLWSGVRRLVSGATREDAAALFFDEGPVFEQSYAYLRERGVEIVTEVLRDEARVAFELYAEAGGSIYNG
jgi:tRNA(Arg) A34 adenosine deaminase TadA